MCESEETRTAIMEATFEALAEHGYADLTIQTIADEFEKSKSLLYYHFETKEDLLGEFLGYLTDQFVAQVQAETAADATADERLRATLDLLVPTELEVADRRFRTALLELRLQAPYSETYAVRFEALDARLDSTFEAILTDGVKAGEFDVDPAVGAHVLTTAVTGEMLRMTTGGTDPATAREAVYAVVSRFRT
jgi:AcrR family transcriptional regulator